ncbi:MAG TPA: zinc-dependent metalloprotease, partial [Niastella sp.]
DVTEFLNSDNDVLYFQKKQLKDRAGMGAQQNDRSYIDYIHSYATNLEIHAVKTYAAGMNPTASNYTVELNSSLVLLPVTPMQPRLLDKRVGYFAVGHRDFESNTQGVEDKIFAIRWRLEPKPEDVEKYKRGELVEPAKPIVFYIDPVTPKKWVPYLMQGVNDWQKAFEKAGFKNAIYAREAPTKEEDSTWSIDDATHSAIIYRPSVIANAMGPSVADPRSGEIIESHIFWYHNVMALLSSWYMAQCGAVDPNALHLQLSDSLMGTLIRFVSSHEVGHTLGLRHNFGSSSTVPVEKLRDKAWVEAHGHTPSIMDYARFNYVAQPEDHISEKGLFPRINDYDNWAIQWGYTWRPEYKNEFDEQKALAKVVSDSLAKNNRLWFGNEMSFTDYRCQNEDLSDDVVKANEYGIKNLKRLVPNIMKWATVPNEDFEKPFDMYKTLFGQFNMYLGHATNIVGSIERTDKVGAQAGALYESTSYEKQKNAIQFLVRNIFTTPMWLKNDDMLNKTATNFPAEVNQLQSGILTALLSRNRMGRMLWMEQNNEAGKKAYTLNEMLQDLNKSIFTEVYAGKSVDVYRRGLQKTYVSRLLQQVFMQLNDG